MLNQRPEGSAMLSGASRRVRTTMAIGIAAIYAFCVVTPAVALAVIAGPTTIHCFIGPHGFASSDHGDSAHMHGDGTSHHHATHDDDGSALSDHADGGGK